MFLSSRWPLIQLNYVPILLLYSRIFHSHEITKIMLTKKKLRKDKASAPCCEDDSGDEYTLLYWIMSAMSPDLTTNSLNNIFKTHTPFIKISFKILCWKIRFGAVVLICKKWLKLSHKWIFWLLWWFYHLVYLFQHFAITSK